MPDFHMHVSFADTGRCLCQGLWEGKSLKLEPVVGIEPTTDGLQNRCSTTELNWLEAPQNLFWRSLYTGGHKHGQASID